MRLEDSARAILFGARLDDKLLTPSFEDGPHAPLLEAPRFPGRPPRLARIGKAEFPRQDRLASEETARGQVLHFFANHELLALELMALVLLRFPEAPPAFRQGVARTIAEEQGHMRLYIERMRELGVDFGDLPLSDYFWNAIKDMSSPLEFVVQMSLTLEQANLDFSLHYQQAIAQTGDDKTAAILERVYQEEIGHVRHGVQWFNRFRDGAETESDWDAYLRLLPPPMTPRRAKGLGFSAESRRLAGLSERFISELEIYGGSKGRPPVYWRYNPMCEAEIARGKPGFVAPEPVRRLSGELEPLLMHLASPQDVVWVGEAPSAAWLRRMRELGFSVPEFRVLARPGETPRDPRDPRDPKIGGLEPWGWSPEPFERFRPWRDRLSPGPGRNAEWAAGVLAKPSFAETGLGALFSKRWSANFLHEWLKNNPDDQAFFGGPENAARVRESWPEARADLERALAGRPQLAKAPWGTSGNQNRRVLATEELDGPLGGWIRGVIESQGAILVEPWLDKRADLSIQLQIASGAVKLLGIRRFYVGRQLEFRGTELDPRLTSLGEEALRFLHAEALDRFKRLAHAVGERLAQAGYQGPAGIDAMLWRAPDGELRLKPLVELNPRWTMGRVALAIEERVLPGVPARWAWFFRRDMPESMTLSAWGQALERRRPVRISAVGGGLRISEGIVLTSDADRSSEVLTLLAVGTAAVGELPIDSASEAPPARC